jgi:hypothetical protein
MSGNSRGRFVCLSIIALLYIASIPWYRDSDAPLRLWFGLPDWVAVALLCYVGVAILNALAWHWTDISDVSEVSEVSEQPEAPR